MPSTTSAGDSGTPLARKPGITQAAEVLAVGAPAENTGWLAPRPPGVAVGDKVRRSTTPHSRRSAGVATGAGKSETAHPTTTTHSRGAMASGEKVKGPASYFPSTEKTYGQPIAHWMKVLSAAGAMKHMELVALLKTEHAMGHGHANALVAWFMAQKK